MYQLNNGSAANKTIFYKQNKKKDVNLYDYTDQLFVVKP